jgi:Ca2+-binding RTX toxin-like protein
MTDINASGEQIGSVISMTGSAWAISGNTQRPLTEGAPVYEGEEIVTESDSNVEIRLADNTILGQGEDSAISLDDYVYSEDANSLDFSMIKGVLRVVSGEIVKANPEGFNLSTPMATIGIRGTEVMIQIDQGREIIGVDKIGEGHQVIISNAFNQVIIDSPGMFSGIDFDGSLIVPDEMPDNFISAIVRSAPLTILGDPSRNPGDSQQVIPPQFYETINNQTGEVQPGEGMVMVEEDEEEDQEFEMTEEEIEALLELETAAGTEAGIPGELLGEIVETQYDPFGNDPNATPGDPAPLGGTEFGGDENSPGDDDVPPLDEPPPDIPPADTIPPDTPPIEGAPPPEPPPADEAPQEEPPPVADDMTVTQYIEEENEPVSYNVIGTGEDTLVQANLEEESIFNGTVEFDSNGQISYIPEPGETGTVVIDYTIANADGDTASAQLSIELAPDSEPVISVTDSTGSEADDPMIVTGTLSADFGADIEGSSIVLTAANAGWSGYTLTADDNSWDITLNGSEYTFTQSLPLDHSDSDVIDIPITVTATDGDNSISTGTFTISVSDDAPTTTDAYVEQEIPDTTVSYNVLAQGDATTGMDGGYLLDATLTENSEFEGTVTTDPNGTITYDPVDGETGLVFIDYTIKDTDGDTSTSQLFIELAEPEPPTEGPVEILINGDFSDVTANINHGWTAANATNIAGWNAGSFYNSSSEGPFNDAIKNGEGHAKIEVWQAGFKGILDPEGKDTGHFVEIDYAGATDFISQTVATTAGAAYVLSFYATIRPDANSNEETVIARILNGDTPITEETYTPLVYDVDNYNESGWTKYTIEFTAESSETTILLTEPQYGDGGNVRNTYGVLIDNVSLTTDPNQVVTDDLGNDNYLITGTAGDDVLFGDDGDDTINGEQGADTIFGHEGDDVLDGGQGADVINGGEGNDLISSGQGADVIDGGKGDDLISGGLGADLIDGGQGADTLIGGKGSDTFVFTSPYDGTDTVLDFNIAMDEITLHEWGVDLNNDGFDDSVIYSGSLDFSDSSENHLYVTGNDEIKELYFDSAEGTVHIATLELNETENSVEDGADII